MSYVFSFMAGAFLTLAILKTSLYEPGWGLLFVASILCALIGLASQQSKL